MRKSLAESDSSPDTTNYAKFQTRNPLAQFLFGRFYETLARLVAEIRPESVLDAGCGEGETLQRLRAVLPREVHGLDNNPKCVEFAAARLPACQFSTGDVCHIDYPDNRFDLILCLEVLEHLAEPAQAMRELTRISREHIIISVPNEPLFRLTNLARGKYVRRWGDHPEHCQHWNQASLTAFLAGSVDIVKMTTCYPWQIAHCRVRRSL